MKAEMEVILPTRKLGEIEAAPAPYNAQDCPHDKEMSILKCAKVAKPG